MVRLKDIAAKAGVSVMTVSKALRDEKDVSARTKTRIKLIAQQMGYVPNSMAQGLRTQTTKLFGLIIPTITNPVYARIVLALEERAHELGYEILLAHTHGTIEREESCVLRLLSPRNTTWPPVPPSPPSTPHLARPLADLKLAMPLPPRPART